ncbi:hypothetical protein D3C72_2124130 [compost metagenome]
MLRRCHSGQLAPLIDVGEAFTHISFAFGHQRTGMRNAVVHGLQSGPFVIALGDVSGGQQHQRLHITAACGKSHGRRRAHAVAH